MSGSDRSGGAGLEPRGRLDEKRRPYWSPGWVVASAGMEIVCRLGVETCRSPSRPVGSPRGSSDNRFP